MKLFIMKLLSLIVICLGLVSLAYAFGIAPVTDFIADMPDRLVEWKGLLPEPLTFLGGMLDVKILWIVGSVSAVVFGVYGFFPRFAKWRKPKKISYDGPHGQVLIQLDTVESSLNNVLARMPEVKKIDVVVEPRDGGRSALIRANAVLQHQPGQNARAIAGLVSDYIAETATKMLGLEELATIELNVTGINVNSRKSSKQIRKESLSHSTNAPVELLEAAPKPMSLSAPGQPLGSGPIEEEMEEEEDSVSESALEASAVGTREDESRQQAARSELLEPLNLHGAPGAPDPVSELDESTESVEEEQVPDIEVPNRGGEGVTASVVPEPLGDIDDDEPETAEDSEEADELEEDDTTADTTEDVDEEDGEGEALSGDDGQAEETVDGLHGESDVEVPEEDEIPDAEAVIEAVNEAEESDESAESVEDGDQGGDEQTYPPNSPWGPVGSDEADSAADETDAPESEPAESQEEASSESGLAFAWEKQSEGGASETADESSEEPSNEPVGGEEATDDSPSDTDEDQPNLMESESTDSIIGDLDEEPVASEGEEPAGKSGDGESENDSKKGWGWFN